MSYAIQDEHRQLASSLRRFFEASGRVTDVGRGQLPKGDEIWSQLATQLELPGISIPAEFGGAGYGTAELSVVMSELGRVLYGSPYFATVALAANALTEAEDEVAQKRWLPGICAGQVTATVAVGEGSQSWHLGMPATTATKADTGWRISGEKNYVVDGGTADLLLVFARVGDGIGLFSVEGDNGVVRQMLSTVDLSRPMATIIFTNAPAIRIGDDFSARLPLLRDKAFIALAAEQAGAARRCLEQATEYAQLRVAFGRQIGSYQAVKHRCADMLVEVALAEATAAYAASVVDPAEFSVAAALAKAICSDAFLKTAWANVQVHGGIGFTWEHDAHLFVKRAKASALMFGNPVEQRRRLGELLELAPSGRL